MNVMERIMSARRTIIIHYIKIINQRMSSFATIVESDFIAIGNEIQKLCIVLVNVQEEIKSAPKRTIETRSKRIIPSNVITEVVPPPFTLKLMLVNPFMGSDKDGVLGINAQII